MRCNPLRWLWGLLPIFALIWLAVIWEKEPIEEDLRQRTEAALNEAGLSWAGAGFDGRDGLLKGLSFSEDHPQRAIEIARNVWGVRVVDEDIDVIDLVSNYAWSAERTDGAINLTGYVPDEKAREMILKEVQSRLPSMQMADGMKLGRGAPPRDALLSGIRFGLDRLTQMSQGRVELAGLNFSIAGEARDFNAYKGIKAALRGALPAKVHLVQDAVRPPLVKPYTWRAAKSGSQLVLEGHTPSEDLREELFSAAKKEFARLVIIDRMEPGAGAPDRFPAVVRMLLDRLAALKTGEATLRDREVAMRGEAPDKATADRLVADITAALPEGYRFTHDITFPDPKPAPVSPFTTEIRATDGQVEVAGYVPSEEAREELVATLRRRFEGRRILEGLQLASGAGKSWRQCLEAGLAAISSLGGGTLSLTDDQLRVTGETDDPDKASQVEGALRSATTRLCRSDIAIRLNLPEEPDLRWLARYDGAAGDSAGRVVLAGEVPDLDTVNLLLADARKSFPDAEIENRMSIAGGVAERWQKVALRGVRLLSLLRSGEARLERQTLTIDGVASDTAAGTTVSERLTNNLPESYTGVANIEIKSDAMLWAEIEAKRKAAETEARRQAEAEAEERRKAEAETEARRKAEAEAEARRKAEAEAEARRKAEAEAEARRKAEAEAEARRKAEAEAEARRKAEAEAEARRKAEAETEARRKAEAEAEARRKAEAEAEARRKAEAEAEARRKAEAEAEARRKAEAETEARRKAEAEAEARRKAEAEAEARRKAEAEAEARRKAEAEAEARRKAEAEAEARRRAEAEAEARRKAEAEAEARRRAEAEAEARRKAEAEAEARRSAEVEAEESSPPLPEERQRTAAAIPPEALACQQRMSRIAREGRILFETAKSDVSRASFETLDKLAKAARDCPGVVLNVEGHTDSVGGRRDNQELSLQRSQAVIDYLTNAGVPRSRLRAVGHGEDRPLKPNNNSANRASNRRIEFSVYSQS